jgi:hypothetical protein
MRVPGRECGDCSLCCKLLVVAELDKPQNIWCRHLKMGTGCGIYATRPESCREFYCRWMEDATLGPEWKPSKSKMMLAHLAEHQLSVHVDPGATGVWRKEPYFSHLSAMAKSGLKNNAILKIMDNGRTFVLLPNRVVDLGVVGQKDEIVLAKRPAPGGPVYDVAVTRSER